MFLKFVIYEFTSFMYKANVWRCKHFYLQYIKISFYLFCIYFESSKWNFLKLKNVLQVIKTQKPETMANCWLKVFLRKRRKDETLLLYSTTQLEYIMLSFLVVFFSGLILWLISWATYVNGGRGNKTLFFLSFFF